MAEATAQVSRTARRLGLVLLVCGALGLLAGLAPFLANLLRVLGCDFGVPPEHWASHGPAAMGMSVEWAVLSSADGMFLGALLIAAGIGWRRGKPWAPLVTLIYAIDGLLVTGTDLTLFAFYATPGRIRNMMLALDAVAFAVALATLVGLLVWWRRR